MLGNMQYRKRHLSTLSRKVSKIQFEKRLNHDRNEEDNTFEKTGIRTIVLSVIVAVSAYTAYAQDVAAKTPLTNGSLQKINEYFSTQTITYSDGTMLSRDMINGPPKPPPGYGPERAAVALPESDRTMAVRTMTVPAFNWVFGCSAVSGAMIAGYYDRNGFPNMYTGPTNGGVMPLDNSSWPTWSDGHTTYPNLPLAASHNGVDGRVTRGSIDDYWIQYGSGANDPYLTGSWTQHAWGEAIGDYMKTGQSAYGNTDGSTSFYNYTSSAAQLTCGAMEGYGISTLDGTYGRKLFYEARGYTVTDCYNQKTDNTVAGGFSFAQYKAEIFAGRPVMLNLNGHTIVGVGYDDVGNTVYIHDTWDYNNHTMTWGGTYSGMQLLSVSIVNPEPAPDTLFYGGFNEWGLYKYDGGTWSRLDPSVPVSMVVSGTTLYASFNGWGLYKYDSGTWSRLDPSVPVSMVVSGTTLYASFNGWGLYKYDSGTWSRLDPSCR